MAPSRSAASATTLPRSVAMILSAMRGPMPGSCVSAARSSCSMARATVLTESVMARAALAGPIPSTLVNLRKKSRSGRRRKPTSSGTGAFAVTW